MVVLTEENCPAPFKYVDVMRGTSINLEDKTEARIEDYWVGTADDDSVNTLINQLADLLDLRCVIQVGLGYDHLIQHSKLLPFWNKLVLQAIHKCSPPGIACVGRSVTNFPWWRVLGYLVTVGALTNWMIRVQEVIVV